uniref:E3 ubiquitin-protein ligase hrd-1 n=1 Tax=Trichuris muris TaxID=70415 RepID=A0A5S6QV17_TRIMR
MQVRHSHLISLSFFLTGAVLANAFYQRKQFYPSMVYLTKSNPSMAVLYIQAFVLVTIIAKVFLVFFFGSLRQNEQENVMERAWFAVTETCLAFTVFRDDFNSRFVAQFTQLFFFKCFHWMAEERVDYMERTPVVTALFCARMMGLIAVLSAVDSYHVSHAYFTTLLRGASVQLVFGFEYAVLLTIILQIAIKFTLYRIDSRHAHPWENKAVYLLYTELVIEFFRVILYGVFVTVMMQLHAFPLFSIRPMYLTVKSFKKAVVDAILSRRAINNMNTMYPDATAEELRQGDVVCIICREEISEGAKKLPCNHIFHTACLRSWFQRQQTCPTCRLNILQATASQTRRQQQPAQSPPLPQTQPDPGVQQAVPNFATMFPFLPPNFFQQGSLRQDQSTQGDQATGSAQSPFAQFAQNLPSGTAPFIPMPPPFVLPFPSPPNFVGLTDEEVRQMEGMERASVEARVRALRNISTLLDAALVQLQQYTTVLNTFVPALSAVSLDRSRPTSTPNSKTNAQEQGSSARAAGLPFVQYFESLNLASQSNGVSITDFKWQVTGSFRRIRDDFETLDVSILFPLSAPKGQSDWRHSVVRNRQATEDHRTWSLITVKPVNTNDVNAVLQLLKDILLAGTNLPFIPLFAKASSNGVLSFYLQDKVAADALVASSGKVSLKDGKLSIWKRISKPPFSLLDGAQCELMKTVLMKRYDSTSQRLNLSNFGRDESFIEYRVDFPLTRPAVSIALVDILSKNPTTLTEIDFSCNGLIGLDHVANVVFCSPQVTRLDLTGNRISNLDELKKVASWNLTALSLKENPVTNSLNMKRRVWIRRLLEIFPLLKTLNDGEISDESLLPQFGLLTMKGSYVVNDAVKSAVATFLRDYYAIFDSNKKSRVQLMKIYEAEQSQMTVSLNNQHSRTKSNICTSKRWKGLLRYNHELLNMESWHFRRDCLEFSGSMSIVCFLKERIPEIKHELDSFLVDVAVLEENIAICSVTGYFNDPQDPPSNRVKEFSRTVVLEYRPGGLIILNDLMYFCGTTAHAYSEHMGCLKMLNVQYEQVESTSSTEQMAQGLGVATPFSSNLVAQEVPPKDAMVAEMTKVTGMKPSWAAKCLADNNWQFQLACNNFVNLRDSGVIPADAFN